MNQIRRSLILVVILDCLAATANAEGVPLDHLAPAEKAAYVSCLLPWPKELKFAGKVRLAPENLKLVMDKDARRLVRAASDELRAFVKQKAGVDIPVVSPDTVSAAGFSVRVGVRSSKTTAKVPGVPDMADLPNAEQSYAIIPIRESDSNVAGLALVGQGETGAYHAAKTLLQLLDTAFQQEGAKKQVDVPVVSVRDWPDLAERGFWGSYTAEDMAAIRDLSARKFNTIETLVREYGFAEDGTGQATIEPELVALARRHAIRVVPSIVHLAAEPARTMVRRYPETQAVGERGVLGDRMAFCHVHPRSQKVLNEWITSLARLQGIDEVSGWLTENLSHPYCSCPECKTENWFVSETRMLVRAWQAAKAVNPNLRLRILLSQGSYEYNDLVLKAVPPEVGVSYYSGMHTYSASREPMIYPALREFARRGRWLGVYPQLVAVWKYNTPFPCPQFVHTRMNEFVDAGLSNVCGRLHPIEWPYFHMNFDAAAQWSWNAKGRTVQEFVEAWATGQGFKEPAKVAKWAETIGPVVWDVHEGHFPLNFGQMVRLLGGKTELGKEAFRGFPAPKRFDQDLAACRHAADLARDLDSEILIAQTEVISSYVTLLKCLHALSEKAAGEGDFNSDDREFFRRTCETFDNARESLVAGLRRWYAAVQKDRDAEPWRFDSTIENLEKSSAVVVGFCKWMAGQTKGTARLAVTGFGRPETIGGKTAFNADETGRGDGGGGFATVSFIVKDFDAPNELHLAVWGKSDPVNVIICTEGQGRGYSQGGKWTRVAPRGSVSGEEQWDHLVFRLTPDLYDRASCRQTVGLGGGDSQIWVSEAWIACESGGTEEKKAPK